MRACSPASPLSIPRACRARPQNNIDAATTSEAHELLTDEPPNCRDENDNVLACSIYDDATIRSGIYELAEIARPDRRFYCQHPLVKRAFLENASVLEEECRATFGCGVVEAQPRTVVAKRATRPLRRHAVEAEAGSRCRRSAGTPLRRC